MRRKVENPRVILLDCPLEYKKGESQTNVEFTKDTDFTATLEEERKEVKALCDQLIALKPDVVVTEKAQQPIFDVPGEYMITTYDVVQGIDFVMPVNQVTLRTDFVAETYNLTLSGFADACKDVMTFAQAHQRFRQTNAYLFPDNRRCYLRLSDQAKSTNNQMYAPGKWKRWVMAQRK